MKKLCVWDFDGTLVETPIASPENKLKWANYYNKPWPFTGWWDHDESMDSYVWDMPVVNEVFNAYQLEKKNLLTINVLLTGRLKQQEERVKHIVHKRGYCFDHYLFNLGGITLLNKLTHLDYLLSIYPTVFEVALWDDRTEHFNAFEEWGCKLKETGRINSFLLTKIKSTRWVS